MYKSGLFMTPRMGKVILNKYKTSSFILSKVLLLKKQYTPIV